MASHSTPRKRAAVAAPKSVQDVVPARNLGVLISALSVPVLHDRRTGCPPHPPRPHTALT